MAVLYVRSTDGDDADNGSTWALAKATLAGAFAAAAEGGASGNILFGTGATQADFVFDNCRLEAMGTSSTLNRSGYHVITYTLKDTVVKFGGASG